MTDMNKTAAFEAGLEAAFEAASEKVALLSEAIAAKTVVDTFREGNKEGKPLKYFHPKYSPIGVAMSYRKKKPKKK